MRIIVLGSINMDLVMKTNKFPKQGETVIGDSFYTNPGGKGANQASTIGKMGMQPIFIGQVGNDVYGPQLIENLKQNNVDTTNIKTVNKNSGIAVITVYQNDNRIILDSGANHLIDTMFLIHTLSNYDHESIFLTQFETNIDAVTSGLALAKEKGMYTCLNPAPFIKTSKSIYQGLDLLVLNEIECLELTGIAVTNSKKIEEALSYIKQLGVKTTIITLGEKGSLLYEDNIIHRIQAVKTKAQDTTCAGDSYIGAVLYQLAMGLPLKEACNFAAKVASITVSRKGAQQSIPTLDEVNQ